MVAGRELGGGVYKKSQKRVRQKFAGGEHEICLCCNFLLVLQLFACVRRSFSGLQDKRRRKRRVHIEMGGGVCHWPIGRAAGEKIADMEEFLRTWPDGALVIIDASMITHGLVSIN